MNFSNKPILAISRNTHYCRVDILTIFAKISLPLIHKPILAGSFGAISNVKPVSEYYFHFIGSMFYNNRYLPLLTCTTKFSLSEVDHFSTENSNISRYWWCSIINSKTTCNLGVGKKKMLWNNTENVIHSIHIIKFKHYLLHILYAKSFFFRSRVAKNMRKSNLSEQIR